MMYSPSCRKQKYLAERQRGKTLFQQQQPQDRSNLRIFYFDVNKLRLIHGTRQALPIIPTAHNLLYIIFLSMTIMALAVCD